MRAATGIVSTLALAAALCTPAGAFTIHTDPASFLAAVEAGHYLETFDGVDESPEEQPVGFSSMGFAYEADVPGGVFFNYPDPGEASDIWLSTDIAFDSIVFTFTSGNVTAVGGYFFTAVIDGTPTTIDVTVQTDQGGQTITPLASDPSMTFLGFTSETPFSSLTLTAFQPEGFPHWPVANDLIVGAAVPEPAPGALLLAASGWLWRARRRGTRARFSRWQPSSP